MAVDLREFQRQLWHRIEQSSATLPEDQRLGVLAGGEQWLIDLRGVEAVMPLGTVSEIPTVKSWLCGLVNVRGDLVSVIDLGLFAGLRPTARDMNARLILLSPAFGVTAGLLVAQTIGLKNPRAFETQPKAVGLPAWIIAQRLDANGSVFNELDVGLLVRNEMFLHPALES